MLKQLAKKPSEIVGRLTSSSEQLPFQLNLPQAQIAAGISEKQTQKSWVGNELEQGDFWLESLPHSLFPSEPSANPMRLPCQPTHLV